MSLRICFWTCCCARLAARISPGDVVFCARRSALLRSARSRPYSLLSIADASSGSKQRLSDAALGSKQRQQTTRARKEWHCRPLKNLLTSPNSCHAPEFLWTSTDPLDDCICGKMVTAKVFHVSEPGSSCQQGGRYHRHIQATRCFFMDKCGGARV